MPVVIVKSRHFIVYVYFVAVHAAKRLQQLKDLVFRQLAIAITTFLH